MTISINSVQNQRYEMLLDFSIFTAIPLQKLISKLFQILGRMSEAKGNDTSSAARSRHSSSVWSRHGAMDISNLPS